jgi:hypothetical protein
MAGARGRSLVVIGGWLGLNLMGVVVAAAAMAGGAAGKRWGYVLVLFCASTVAVVLSLISDRALLGRSRHLRGSVVPWDVQLKRPRWITVGEYLSLMAAGLFVGGVAAMGGLPRVGLGLAILSAMFFLVVSFGKTSANDTISFRRKGLWIQIDNLRFVVGWDAVERIDVVGPNHYQTVVIHVKDVPAVTETVDPATPATRARVEALVGRQGLILTPWSGGLDGATLTRFVAQARDAS